MAVNMTDMLNDVKENLIIIGNDEDDNLLKNKIKAAIAYAEAYQHVDSGFYSEADNDMSENTRLGVIMLASHYYESRDGATGGFYNDRVDAAEQTMKAVDRLLRLDREWKV